LGRLLNEARWLLEQAVFFDEALPPGGVDALLKALIPQVRGLVGDPGAERIERRIHKSIKGWSNWTSVVSQKW
jgi:hypothetical protein